MVVRALQRRRTKSALPCSRCSDGEYIISTYRFLMHSNLSPVSWQERQTLGVHLVYARTVGARSYSS